MWNSLFFRYSPMKLLEVYGFCAYNPLELWIFPLSIYTSTVEEIECKMLFTSKTRGTRHSCSSSVSSFRLASFLCCSLSSLVLIVCKYDPWEISVSKPSKSDSNQRNMKFKLNALFIVWGKRISFLFVGRQDIINYCNYSSEFFRNCHKRLVPKNARHDYWEMFVKTPLPDRLVCFAAYVGKILLAVVFRPPLPNCLFIVWLPTLFAAVLIFLLPIKISAISDSGNSNKSAPWRFAAGMIYLRQNGKKDLPITCAKPPNPRLRCWQIPL